MRNNKIAQITVLSAITIITFTGAATVIIPTPVNAETLSNAAINFSNIELEEIDYDLYDQFKIEGVKSYVNFFERWRLNPEVLEYLGISSSEMIESRIQGKTFNEIAEDQDKDLEEVANIYEDIFVDRLNEKLQDGRISPERYEKIVSRLDSIREKFLQN